MEREQLIDALLPQPDQIPTIDDLNEDKTPVATYKAWTRETTRVVTYTNNAEAWPKDRPSDGYEDAYRLAKQEFGEVLETNIATSEDGSSERYFFRVRRS